MCRAQSKGHCLIIHQSGSSRKASPLPYSPQCPQHPTQDNCTCLWSLASFKLRLNAIAVEVSKSFEPFQCGPDSRGWVKDDQPSYFAWNCRVSWDTGLTGLKPGQSQHTGMSWSPWAGDRAENKADTAISSRKPSLIHPSTNGSGAASRLPRSCLCASHYSTIILGCGHLESHLYPLLWEGRGSSFPGYGCISKTYHRASCLIKTV